MTVKVLKATENLSVDGGIVASETIIHNATSVMIPGIGDVYEGFLGETAQRFITVKVEDAAVII